MGHYFAATGTIVRIPPTHLLEMTLTRHTTLHGIDMCYISWLRGHDCIFMVVGLLDLKVFYKTFYQCPRVTTNPYAL